MRSWQNWQVTGWHRMLLKRPFQFTIAECNKDLEKEAELQVICLINVPCSRECFDYKLDVA